MSRPGRRPAAPSPSPTSVRDLVGPALAAGDLHGAQEFATWALARDPVAARLALGQLQLARGQHSAAAQSFLAVLVAAPGAPGVRAWLATALLAQGDAAAALAALAPLEAAEVRADPLAAAAYARALAAQGRRSEAADAVQAARDAAPDDVGLALLQLRLGRDQGALDLDAALADLADLAERWPGLADIPMLRAELLAEAGDLAAAIAALEAHLGLAIVAPALALLLAELRLRSGAHAEVSALLPLLGQLCAGRADLLCELASLMGELGDSDGAALLLEDACAADSAAAEPRYRLGLRAEALGDLPRAASWYRAALAGEPRHEAARSRLAALAR